MTATPHLGGIDWLALTIYGEVAQRYYGLVDQLTKQRDAMRTTRGVDCDVAYIGPHVGALSRQGLGSGFNHMPLVWRSQGITFQFGADRRKSDGTTSKLPLMFVDIPGNALLINGEIACLRFVQDVLSCLGIDAGRVAVRRVDMCLDMVGEYRDRFREVIARGTWLTRGSAVKPNYTAAGKFTGFEVKGGACSLTVYDKLEEMRIKKPEIIPAMVQHRWHGDLPEEAWRVEFCIRPGKHNRMDFRGLDSLLRGLRGVVGWACCSWFRLTKKRHKNHSERDQLDPLWEEIIAGFWGWADADAPLVPRVVKSYDARRVAAVGLGCLVKALAMAGVEPDRGGLDEALSDLFAVYLRGERGEGLEGTTEAERKAHWAEKLADMSCKFYRIWAQLAGRK